MSLVLVAALLLLLLCAAVGFRLFSLPKNVWLLFIAQPLAMTATSLMVFAGGILGTKLAPTPEMATLPISVLIVGVALAVLPASLLTRRLGRRLSLLCGLSIAVIGALVAMSAALTGLFSLLVVGSFLLGLSMAFVAQMRFSALDSLDDLGDSAKALSILMVGGIFAAILGPELAVAGKDWIEAPHGFAGSFLGLGLFLVMAMVAVSFLEPTDIQEQKQEVAIRPLSSIIKQPIFVIALGCGAVAYGLMSYVMTATPLSMHMIEHYDLDTTKWVVQSHIMAMYIPSLFSALLLRWLGVLKMMWLGCLCYLAVIFFALSGKEMMHYWWAMVLLGIGWNFLFLCGTLSLPKSYQQNERLKVQSVNDLTIFVIQAMASLLAGSVLFTQGWLTLIAIGIPLVVIICLLTLWVSTSSSLREKIGS